MAVTEAGILLKKDNYVISRSTHVWVDTNDVSIGGLNTPRLTADKNGWYIDGKKILTED